MRTGAHPFTPHVFPQGPGLTSLPPAATPLSPCNHLGSSSGRPQGAKPGPLGSGQSQKQWLLRKLGQVNQVPAGARARRTVQGGACTGV